MKDSSKELIQAERNRTNFNFIAEVIQKGRIRQSTYCHELIMPESIYIEMNERGLINHEDYYILQQAFFEFRHGKVIISFQHLFACEDFHHLIDRFLISKSYGFYPIERNGISKMNFDKNVKNYKL
jgi:hypothetical protein